MSDGESEEFSANEDINAVGQRSKSKRGKRSYHEPPTKDPPKIKECLFCGGTHAFESKSCRSSGQKCKKCGKEGHFAVKCRSKPEDAKVHMVEQKEVSYIHSISGKDQALVSLTLNGSASVIFQIDTGSFANTLPLQDYIRATKDFSKTNIVPKEITLVMHDHSKGRALGSARPKVENKGNKHELNFVIVDQEVTPLLGFTSSQGMGLVKIMMPGVDAPVNNVVAAPKIESAVPENVTKNPVLSPFADVFHGIVCLPGQYNIQLNKDVQPVVHPLMNSACSQERSNEDRA